MTKKKACVIEIKTFNLQIKQMVLKSSFQANKCQQCSVTLLMETCSSKMTEQVDEHS